MLYDSKIEILKASAGSGKTFQLTKEFIKILILNPNEYHQILALTFTNNAKNEMKSRVLKELSILSFESKGIMLTAIEADFSHNKTPLNKKDIQRRSSIALSNILYDYGRFNIITLDQFFTQLIRHLARELKLNINYELSLDTTKALNESVQSLYISNDSQVKKWIKAFINSKIEEDKGWNIEFNIKNIGYKLFQDSFIDFNKRLKENVANLENFVVQLKKEKKLYQVDMHNAGIRAINLIKKYRLEVSDFRKNTATVFEKLKDENYDLNKDFSKTFIEANWSTKSTNKEEEIKACVSNGLEDIHNEVIELSKGEKKENYVEATNILANIYSYGVLSALSENLLMYRNKNNLLLLSDTAIILDGVIVPSDIPFIYEKISSKFKYIMIDEFQDTSSHQWKNILPLLQHTLSNQGSVLLVGDVKQSIYRWRGGDTSLLMNRAAEDLEDYFPEENSLDINYRSGKNIVSFNNEFFKIAATNLTQLISGFFAKGKDIIEAYSTVEQGSAKDFYGYVKVQFFDNNNSTEWKDKAFEATEDTIRQALSDGFHPSDILVLVRKNKEASEVATYLLSKGIDAITDEALHLSKSPLVQFIINALELINRPTDKLALANVSFFATIIRNKTANESIENLSIEFPFSEFPESLSAYETIEKLIEIYRLNEKSDPFLQGIQELCLSLSQQKYLSTSHFIEEWKELHEETTSSPSIIMGEDTNAVRVKSIHKSKGLESPIVIIPQVNGKIYIPSYVFWATNLPDKYKKWASLPLRLTNNLKDSNFEDNYINERYHIALEELNTLYVAFTRAVERLYVFVNAKEHPDTSQKIVKEVLKNQAFSLHKNFDGEIFELGTLEKPKPRSGTTIKTTALENYPSSNYRLKLEPSNSTDFLKKNSTAQAKEGIHIHSIMAQLTTFKLPLIDLCLEKITRLMVSSGEITASQATNYKKKIIKLFTDIPNLHQWFSPKWEVINEEKILANGKIYIPDRVSIKDNNAIIIDFKHAIKLEEHRKQIKKYGDLLIKMGYKVGGMYLIYVELFELEEVE